jgi:solute carrier family 25 phosphate transporter 3
MSTPGAVLLAPSPTDFSKYDTMYYIKGAAAGGICCSLTHGALTPVDVVKTRMQLDPIKVRRSTFKPHDRV